MIDTIIVGSKLLCVYIGRHTYGWGTINTNICSYMPLNKNIVKYPGRYLRQQHSRLVAKKAVALYCSNINIYNNRQQKKVYTRLRAPCNKYCTSLPPNVSTRGYKKSRHVATAEQYYLLPLLLLVLTATAIGTTTTSIITYHYYYYYWYYYYYYYHYYSYCYYYYWYYYYSCSYSYSYS